MSEITVLLEQARAGQPGAWDQVVRLLYADLKRLARSACYAAGAHEATALVHDCYLRLNRGVDKIENRAHFLSVASTAMRQLLINHARDLVAQKRGGNHRHTTLGKIDRDTSTAVQSEAEELLAIDAALRQLAHVDPRLVQVVQYRLFAGLSEEETASALGLPLRSTQRLWQQARRTLRAMLDEAA